MPRGNTRMDLRAGGDEIMFFASRCDWIDEVRRRFPRAKLVSDGKVIRAFVKGVKIAAFGSLPGHGYVATLWSAQAIGEHIHRDSNRKVDLAVFRGAVIRGTRRGP